MDNEIEIVNAEEHEAEFIQLVREYTNWVESHSEVATKVMESQHVDEELEDVSKKFGGNTGRMFLALVDDKPAGCIAVKEYDDDICELKRMYVRSDFRGLGLSTKLAKEAIRSARELGYHQMRLDSFEWMTAAIALYGKLGFKRIPRYNDNMADDAVFVELNLQLA